MTEFEYAQARPSTEQERLQFLHNAFMTDPRPNTKSYFMSCHSNMLTYHQTLEKAVVYSKYVLLPEKPVKIAALSTTPEACRKFLAGTCLLGTKCKYYAPAKPKAATPPSGKTHPPAPPGSAVALH